MVAGQWHPALALKARPCASASPPRSACCPSDALPMHVCAVPSLHRAPTPQILPALAPPGTPLCGATARPASCGWRSGTRRCRTRRSRARSTPNTSRSARAAPALPGVRAACGAAPQAVSLWQGAEPTQQSWSPMARARWADMSLCCCCCPGHACSQVHSLPAPARRACAARRAVAGGAPQPLNRPQHSASLPPQAWYREGRAAEGLKRWEDAATAFYQAAQLQPENEEFIRLTKEAIVEGRKEFQAQQGQQQQQAAGPAASSSDGATS